MVFGNREDLFGIKWPADVRDPSEIERGNLARYMCRGCSALWDDEDRNKAVRSGSWRDRDGGEDMWAVLRTHKPAKIAFHIPAWLSYFVVLSECAAAFLRGLKNRRSCATSRTDTPPSPGWNTSGRQEDAILSLCDERPEGIAPGGGIVGPHGRDRHAGRRLLVLHPAWGFAESEESWQVREGFLTSFADLERVLFLDEYRDADGLVYPVQIAVQDAMGHRTTEVYDFCRRYRGWNSPSRARSYQVFCSQGLLTPILPARAKLLDRFPLQRSPRSFRRAAWSISRRRLLTFVSGSLRSSHASGEPCRRRSGHTEQSKGNGFVRIDVVVNP